MTAQTISKSGPTRWGPKFAMQLKNEFEKVQLQDLPENCRQVHPLIKTSAFRDRLYQTIFEAQGIKQQTFRKHYRPAIMAFQDELKMSDSDECKHPSLNSDSDVATMAQTLSFSFEIINPPDSDECSLGSYCWISKHPSLNTSDSDSDSEVSL